MQAFFASPLSYWGAAPASVTAVASTAAWPPAFSAIGHAPCMRTWKPQEGVDPSAAEFTPVLTVAETDGSRKSAIAVHGDCVAVGDTSSSGLVSIWDTKTWQRKQMLQACAAVTVLLMNSDYIAAGTSHGNVKVWKREAGGDSWDVAAGQGDYQVEPPGRPCMTACLGNAPDGACLLVGHSASRCRLSVWRLADGQLLQTLGCVVDASNAAAMAVQTNVQFAFMDGWMLTMVSWMQGHDPAIQVMDVLARQSQDLKAPDRLAGRGKPLAADFRGGKILAVGFEDGAVAAFGYHGWLRFHGGSVGAVRTLPERMQVVSGGADGVVKLWSGEGALLASLDMGFQVTALTAGDLHLVAGGARGELQLLVLAALESRPEDDKAGGEAGSTDGKAATVSAPPTDANIVQYELYFDSRSAKGGDGGVQGRASDHAVAFAGFTQPHRPTVSAEELLAAVGSSSEQGAGEAAGGPGTSSSKFDPKAAMSGAARSEKDSERDAAEQAEALKKKKLAQMGEDKGVARTPSVVLESNTARIGRKCDSVSCLAREGLGGVAFKRCGACRSVWYCSAHCQQTHWRDRHSKECSVMAQAAKERLKQEKAEEEEERLEQQKAEKEEQRVKQQKAEEEEQRVKQQKAEGGDQGPDELALSQANAEVATLGTSGAGGAVDVHAAVVDVANIDLNDLD